MGRKRERERGGRTNRERERERQRERDRQTDRYRDTERHRDRQTDRDRQTETDREKAHSETGSATGWLVAKAAAGPPQSHQSGGHRASRVIFRGAVRSDNFP